MQDNKFVEIQPVYEDHSAELEELMNYDAEVKAEERIANQSIIEIAKDLANSKRTNTRNYIITLIISSLTLLVAIASLIVALTR